MEAFPQCSTLRQCWISVSFQSRESPGGGWGCRWSRSERVEPRTRPDKAEERGRAAGRISGGRRLPRHPGRNRRAHSARDTELSSIWHARITIERGKTRTTRTPIGKNRDSPLSSFVSRHSSRESHAPRPKTKTMYTEFARSWARSNLTREFITSVANSPVSNSERDEILHSRVHFSKKVYAFHARSYNWNRCREYPRM